MSRRVTAFVSSAVLVLLVAVPAQAAGARSEHERILAYWTPQRIANAVPRDFVRAPGGDFQPRPKPENPGKPGGGGGGGGDGGGDVSGASWTGGGLVKEASGKVLFTMGGVDYICSGAVANDSRGTYSLVLTAGHCTYDETAGEFASNWVFYPDFDESPTYSCAASAYGCWTASALVVHQGYATAGGFNTQATIHDWGFAVVATGGHGQTQLDATVGGSFAIAFSSVADGTSVHAFGYPAAQKYKGNDLVYCAGPTFSDPYNDQLTYGLTCDMTGGSSGGPWLGSFSASSGSGTLRSVNSYGYAGVKAMHGPKFNSKTQATYNSANGATTTNLVVSGG